MATSRARPAGPRRRPPAVPASRRLRLSAPSSRNAAGHRRPSATWQPCAGPILRRPNAMQDHRLVDDDPARGCASADQCPRRRTLVRDRASAMHHIEARAVSDRSGRATDPGSVVRSDGRRPVPPEPSRLSSEQRPLAADRRPPMSHQRSRRRNRDPARRRRSPRSAQSPRAATFAGAGHDGPPGGRWSRLATPAWSAALGRPPVVDADLRRQLHDERRGARPRPCDVARPGGVVEAQLAGAMTHQAMRRPGRRGGRRRRGRAGARAGTARPRSAADVEP